MPGWLTVSMSVLSVGWVAQGWLSVLMLKQMNSLVRKQRDPFPPLDEQHPTVVIVPFKGDETGLANNLKGLFSQDYRDWQVVLVVEDIEDPAVPYLQQAMAEHPDVRSKLLVAGLAPPTEGQKVHNLKAALAWVEDNVPEVHWLAFADSDATADSRWLGNLVGPLRNEKIGCSTGYRWLFPVVPEGKTKPHMASCFASCMNSSAITFMRRKRWRRPWGGSMALRRDVAEAGDLVGAMSGSVSDDLSVHRMVKKMGLATHFEHRCLVRSDVAMDWAGLWQFATRQHTIVRVMDPFAFWSALGVGVLYVAGWATTWALFALACLGQTAMWLGASAAGVLFAMAMLHALRHHLRRSVLLNLFGKLPQVAMPVDRWGTTLWMGLHTAVMLNAMFRRLIIWRGRRYRLIGPNITRIG